MSSILEFVYQGKNNKLYIIYLMLNASKRCVKYVLGNGLCFYKLKMVNYFEMFVRCDSQNRCIDTILLHFFLKKNKKHVYILSLCVSCISAHVLTIRP